MIDVWLTDPAPLYADQALRSAYLDLLSPDERDRHNRFVFDEHRHTYLVAHALVRTTLSRYHPTAPAAWRFARNEHGRPDIDTPESARSLRFNLSHTSGLVAVAVARDLTLGVDVEDRSRRTDTLSVARRFFSEAECTQLFANPRDHQHQRFFDYWTLKEAYIKARGMGLALPLAAFSFDLAAKEPRIAFDQRIDDDPARWHFVVSHPTARHTLAVAAQCDHLYVASHWCVPLNERGRT